VSAVVVSANDREGSLSTEDLISRVIALSQTMRTHVIGAVDRMQDINRGIHLLSMNARIEAARAGAAGAAIALCSDQERLLLRGIEKLTRLAVPVLPNPLSIKEACPTPTAPPRAKPVQSDRPRSNRRGATGAAGKPNPPPAVSSGRSESYLDDGGDIPAFLRQRGHAPAGPAPAGPRPVFGRPASRRSRRATAL
jgi:hypothetical protein